MSKNVILGIGAMVVVIAIVVGAWWWKQSADTAAKTPATSSSATSTPTPTPTATADTQGGTTMKSEDLMVGTGDEAVAGKTVTVNYVGTFTNGTKFDASADHGGTFSFVLGAGNVIKGWDEGVVGMKVGGKRKLTIPSDLAYGPNDYNGIPGGSTLIFEIDLLKVE